MPVHPPLSPVHVKFEVKGSWGGGKKGEVVGCSVSSEMWGEKKKERRCAAKSAFSQARSRFAGGGTGKSIKEKTSLFPIGGNPTKRARKRKKRENGGWGDSHFRITAFHNGKKGGRGNERKGQELYPYRFPSASKKRTGQKKKGKRGENWQIARSVPITISPFLGYLQKGGGGGKKSKRVSLNCA